MLLSELRSLQERCGWLPDEELRGLSKRLRVPLHRIHELATFYPWFRRSPPPPVDVQVCRDLSCQMHGSEAVRTSLENLVSALGAGRVHVGGVSCLGQCDRPCALLLNDHVLPGQTAESASRLVDAVNAGQLLPESIADRSPVPWQIDAYAGAPAYAALRQFVATRDVDRLLKELETSGLRGMGGAGFPTFRKWAAVRAAAADRKYVICNADESEPGTFKDRELLRRAPWLMIEGMVLAGLVTGATQGIIYIRHEYHDEAAAVEEALQAARSLGVVGPDVLGGGARFDLELFVSPGGYIQGEESALLEALEDRRGEPRNKPPFPVTHGLNGKPTVINNVETLSWIPSILLRGGEWYRGLGIRGATGARLVSISGDVVRPGVYEVPFGQTVRELLETAGGLPPGDMLQAIATSGPSGGFLPAAIPIDTLPEKFARDRVPAGAATFDVLDLSLDFGTLQLLGGMLGGAFVVLSDKRDMLEAAKNCTAFFRNESCGKCVPCRVGSQVLTEALGELQAGRLKPEELATLHELSATMNQTSICGLGQVAANPFLTLMRFFPASADSSPEA